MDVGLLDRVVAVLMDARSSEVGAPTVAVVRALCIRCRR